LNQPHCLKKALAGDKQALEELVGICYPAVFRYLCRRTGSRDKAQDLTQDAMVKVLESLHTWRPRPGAGFLSWVFRIARNRAIDEARRTKPRVPLADGEDGDSRFAGLDSTSHGALASLAAEELRLALQRLSPEDRELLELRYYFDFSHKEAAAILGVSPPIVKSRLNAALTRLRKLVCEEDKENDHGKANAQTQGY
jgi:RNA polymerase sigma-70 factor, ECF subfamily